MISELEVLQYAGFWRRFLATLIDSFLFSIILLIIFGPVVMNAGIFTPIGLLQTAVSMVITIVFWMKLTGTPGKLLLSCHVVDAETFRPLTLKQSVIRYVAYLASILPLMLGFVWIAFDKHKQGFHDKIAHTVVLYDAQITVDDESQKSLQQIMSEVR